MTAIAGFCKGGAVFIGGDSAGVSGYDVTLRADPKVFRNGEFLFGFTTSFRMGQLLRFSFAPPKQTENQDVYAYMCTSFVDAVRACLKAGGYATRTNEQESAGTFLVGYRSRLFLIDSDYQVAESRDGYDACGCGHALVRGALFALRDFDITPSVAIETALSAAAHFSAGVRGPFVIEVIP